MCSSAVLGLERLATLLASRCSVCPIALLTFGFQGV